MLIYLEVLGILLLHGLGWAFVFNPFPQSKTALFASAILISCSASAVIWAWVLGLGAGGYVANSLLIPIGIIGWSLAARQRKIQWVTTKQDWAHVASVILIFICVTIFGLGPKVGFGGTIDMALRVGPDALGNVIGSQSLLGNRSINDLEQELVAQSQSRDIGEVLNISSRRMYELSSLRAQVRGEFVVSGLRWGLSGTVATLTTILGEENLWQITAVIPTVSVLAGALLMFELLKLRNKKKFLSAVYVSAIIGNITLLQGWHEGGLGQAFVFPSLLTVLLVLWEQQSTYQGHVLAMIILGGAFVSYSDIMIVLLAVLLVYLSLNLFLDKKRFIRNLNRTSALVFGSLLLVGPFTAQFLGYLPRRLKDSSIGGWPMARWPGITEILGFYPSFPNGEVGLVSRSIFEQTFLSITGMFFLGFIIKLLVTTRRASSAQLVGAVSSVIGLVYLKSTWIDQSSNYQYIKAIGCLAPLGLLALSDLLLTRNYKTAFTRTTIFLLPLAVLTISLNYVATYRATSLRISSTEQRDYIKNREFLDSYVLLSPADFETVALAPFSTLNWMNRYAGGTKPISRGQSDQPLGIVVLKKHCKNWSCITNVPKSNIQSISNTVRIIKLCNRSTCLITPDGFLPNDIIEKINKIMRFWSVSIDEFFRITTSAHSSTPHQEKK